MGRWGVFLGLKRENLKDEGQRGGRLRNLQGQKGSAIRYRALGAQKA